MRLSDAQFRHKALTQEIYDIGDEVATHIDNLTEAVTDWDAALVNDCLEEFHEIVDDARHDARITVAELAGLRQALSAGHVSGVAALDFGPQREPKKERPAQIDGVSLIDQFPLAPAVTTEELDRILIRRTEATVNQLKAIADWVVDQTGLVAVHVDALSLTMMFAKARELVDAVATGWLDTVGKRYPEIARHHRGENPPQFLAERARIEALIARIKARKELEQEA